MDRENFTHHAALNATVNATDTSSVAEQDDDITQNIFYKIRMSVLLLIVIMAVLGNLLVIVSVMRHRFVAFIILLYC